MSNEVCSLPSRPSDAEARAMGRMLSGQRVAIVGLSDDPSRASHGVAAYLRSVGKQIVPVNPNHDQVMGLKCYRSLRQVPGTVDVVDVFRRAEFCAEVTREAIAMGAKGVWLQSGIVSEESRKLAGEAGIDFVQNRCMMVEHRRRAQVGG